VLPGTTMPAMPLTPAESRDVAAYLLALRER
jgi:cytochrome c1